MGDTLAAPPKPLLRGVSHQVAFYLALVAGAILVFESPTPRARIACLIYALALTGLFGVSSLYHRIDWKPALRRWIRKIDHTMIFVLIAGTYTPVALLALPDGQATLVLAVVWGAALAGALWQFFGGHAPKWIQALIYMAMGWVALVTLPQLNNQLGSTAILLLFVGGALYTGGALVYALRRPDPLPRIFGYHEIFHALVVPAAGVHFFVIASLVALAA